MLYFSCVCRAMNGESYCSDEEIITADTGASVFLTGNVKILDAIEDIKMPVYI